MHNNISKNKTEQIQFALNSVPKKQIMQLLDSNNNDDLDIKNTPLESAVKSNNREVLKVILDNDKLSANDIIKWLNTKHSGANVSHLQTLMVSNNHQLFQIILDKLSKEDTIKLFSTKDNHRNFSPFETLITMPYSDVYKVTLGKLSKEDIIKLLNTQYHPTNLSAFEMLIGLNKPEIFKATLDNDKLSKKDIINLLNTKNNRIDLSAFEKIKQLQCHKILKIILDKKYSEYDKQQEYAEYNQSVLGGAKDTLNSNFEILEKDNISYLTQEYALLIDVLKDKNTDTQTLGLLKENPLLTHPSALEFTPQLERVANALLSRSDAKDLPQDIKEMMQNHPLERIQSLYIKNIELPQAEQENILSNKNLFDEDDDLSSKPEALLKSQYLNLDSVNKLFEFHSNNFKSLKERYDKDDSSLTKQEYKSFEQSESLLNALKDRINRDLPCKDNWKEFFKDNKSILRYC